MYFCIIKITYNDMKRERQINFDTQGNVYVRVPSDL